MEFTKTTTQLVTLPQLARTSQRVYVGKKEASFMPDSQSIHDAKWVEIIFEFLHNSRTPGWNIPNTIVYTSTKTIGFYSSSNGLVERITKRNGFQNEFVINFICGANRPIPGEIIAYFVAPVTDDNGHDDEGRLQITYFDYQGVENFVRLANKTAGGVLQQFLPPSGSYNNMIRVCWSPHMFRIELRQCKRPYKDQRYSLQERGATFDANEHDVDCNPVFGKVVEKFKVMVNSLVGCTSSLLPNAHKMTMMVLYFKTTEDAKMHFLFCSVAKTACTNEEALASNQFHRPGTIVNGIRRKHTWMCPSCRRSMSGKELYSISAKIIIAHFMRHGPEKHARKVLGFKQGIHRGEDDWGDEISVFNRVGITTMQAWEYVVYQILKVQHPHIRPDEFAKLRKSDEVLDLKVELCESCCLMFTKTRDDVLRTPNWKAFNRDMDVEELAMIPHFVSTRNWASSFREKPGEDIVTRIATTPTTSISTTMHHRNSYTSSMDIDEAEENSPRKTNMVGKKPARYRNRRYVASGFKRRETNFENNDVDFEVDIEHSKKGRIVPHPPLPLATARERIRSSINRDLILSGAQTHR